MSKQASILFFIMICIWSSLFSQEHFSLKGKIVDEKGMNLPFVQVQLFHKMNGIIKMSTYGWADSLGNFQLIFTPPLLNAFICMNAMGWQSDTLILKDQILFSTFIGSISLNESPIPLNEILIKEKAIAYYQRGDTTIFKPSLYKDGSERVLEDLLAKLPGVRVADDGFLYFRGKRVSKVLWDGDDLLGNDYAKGTKRMPAGIAAEFRFLDKFEGNPLMKSMNRSDQLVLDINVKNTFKGKWIGDSFLGFGLSPFLTAGYSGYRIQKKIKFLSFAEGNTFTDVSPGKKLKFGYADELNSTFQPIYLLSWFVFPSFFPLSLLQVRFNQGKSISFTGGPHWKLGKESYLNMHVDAVLASDFFQQNNFINQWTSLRTWDQKWNQNENLRNLKIDIEGRIKMSEKSNLTFFLHGVVENLSVNKSDSISGISSLPFSSTEQVENEKYSFDLHTDWIYRPDSKKVWRIKSWSHLENMSDSYDWKVKKETSFNTQYVFQSNNFTRLQGFFVKPSYQLEIGTHFNQNQFNAFLETYQDRTNKVRLLSYMQWIGGKTEWVRKKHLIAFSGNVGSASFHVYRQKREIKKNSLLLEGHLRYRWSFSKKWHFESVFQISPVFPDAGQLFKGQIRTGILQRETGMEDLIVPISTQFKYKIHFSDNKRQWESQAFFTLNYKSPYLGNNILSDNQPDWLIEKIAFNLSKGAHFQWNIDKYFLEQSASFGIQLSASRQQFLFGLNRLSGENIFHYVMGKWDTRMKLGKLKLVFSPTIYYRQTKTTNGNLAVLTQFVSSGNLHFPIGKYSYLKWIVEYLPRNTTGNKGWIWAKMEGKFALNEKFYLLLEFKNIFNKQELKLGDLWADSQLIQQFQVNPALMSIKIYKNF